MSTQSNQGPAVWKTLLQQKASTKMKWMVGIMIFIIITATIMYIYTKSTYIDSHCKIIKDVYTDMGKDELTDEGYTMLLDKELEY